VVSGAKDRLTLDPPPPQPAVDGSHRFRSFWKFDIEVVDLEELAIVMCRCRWKCRIPQIDGPFRRESGSVRCGYEAGRRFPFV